MGRRSERRRREPEPDQAGESELVRVRRCTYCRSWKDSGEFTEEGDHVIPASLGGAWIDRSVCEACNRRANEVADELIGKDFLVRYLRAAYAIPDRYGKPPRPPVFTLRLSSGGIVKATLDAQGVRYEAGLPPATAAALALDDLTDQRRLEQIFNEALTGESPDEQRSLELARQAQQRATPPEAWSRFMAKIALACGREAYSDDWLDSRQARILSEDLLGSRTPRFSQRTHHPPVEPIWPYLPPKHQVWIEPHKDTAVLLVALFGQVIGGVAINDLPAEADPSAWSFDPRARTFYRSTYPAIWLGNAARRIQEAGGTPYVIAAGDTPFVFTPDGPDGPVDLGVPTEHVESIDEAFEVARRPRRRVMT